MIEGKLLSRDNQEGRADDDWLAEQGELNWLDDPRRGEATTTDSGRALGEWPPAERPIGVRTRRSPGGASPVGPETIQRRRRVLALATVAVVVVAALAVAIATSGGGGSGGGQATIESVPQTSTVPATPPASTGTTTTGQSTTPAQSRQALKVTLPAAGSLSIGDSGSDVVTLQKALAALELPVGTPDGDFGSKTEAAVIAFQTAHSLDPDGIVGPNTARALDEALAAQG